MSGPEGFSVARGVPILDRTPRVLRALLADLAPEWTDRNEGPETWSPREVVAHLIVGERTDWIPRMRRFLSEDEPALVPFGRFSHLDMAAATPLAELLATFERERRANLAELKATPLDEAALSRTAIHPEFGRVELRQHLACWVAHDLSHIVQIARTMARQYREEVGPWRKYLSALNT